MPKFFVLNAMATTAYHNQFMRDLDKKCAILFLYGCASYSRPQFSYALYWRCLNQMLAYNQLA